jgi:hypothetical protein
LRRQLEVEDVEILGNAGGLDGFWDHRAALLQAPAQHDLCGRLAMCLRNGDDRRVFQRALAVAAIEGNASNG